MSELNWTIPALEDLRAIDRWLENVGPSLALRTLTAIRLRARFLEDFSRGGRPTGDRDVRVLRAFDTPYLILYRLTGDRLGILRIRHEREHWLLEP